MFCPNCGKEMNDGAKLCNNCGWSRKVKISINKKMIILLSGIFVSIIIIILSLSLKNSSIQSKIFYQQVDEATVLINKKNTIDYDEIKTVYFGKYNGVPIEWIVLDKRKEHINNNKIVVNLISKYVLDKVAIDPSKSYGSEDVNLYTSYLYKWLNNTFFYNAFTEEERNKINNVSQYGAKFDSYGKEYYINYGDERVHLMDIRVYYDLINIQPKILISHDIKTNKPIEWWIANTQNYLYVDENGVIQACEKIEDNPLGIRPIIQIEILESD